MSKIGASVAVLLSVAMAPAHAQESAQAATLEEIIVTAQKRAENLQQTAVAVTAVSAEMVENVGAYSLQDIARLAPNTQFAGAVGDSNLYIRGIGQQQSGIFSEPGSVLYIDGVYRPRILAAVNFGGVERIEVLRGPQGTLFGKNAVGGAVNIITAAPTDELHGDIAAQAGSRERRKFEGLVNVPIVPDRLALLLTGESNQQDGYMHDLQTGARLMNTDYYNGRASLQWKPVDDITLTLRGDYTKQDETGNAAKLIGPTGNVFLVADEYAYRGTAAAYNRAKESGTSLTLDWADLGPGAFKSITAYRDVRNDAASDSDGSPLTLLSITNVTTDRFLTQEFQYNAAQLNDRLHWTSGLFYMDETSYREAHPRGTISTNNFGTLATKSYAAFGQATYAITPKLEATAGLRYSHEKKNADLIATGTFSINERRQDSWNATTPKVTLQYQATDDIMVYGTASKGFKSGGYNGAPRVADGFRKFDSEYLWNYEAGVKSEWFGRRLRANLTGYRMDYTDIQVAYQDVTGLSYLDNAGDARINGVEAELTLLATPAFLVNASYGLNDFEYTKLKSGVQTVTTSTVIPQSPKHTAAGGAQYTLSLGNGGELLLRSDYVWRSKIYFDAQNSESIAQASYGLWSARVTYAAPGEGWQAYAYGLNLADEYYHIYGASQAFGQGIIPGAPREIGVGFKLNFGRR